MEIREKLFRLPQRMQSLIVYLNLDTLGLIASNFKYLSHISATNSYHGDMDLRFKTGKRV